MRAPCLHIAILVAFLVNTFGTAPSQAQEFHLSAPGVMVHLSPEFTPALLKGIIIHPENALKFDFIIYKGDQLLNDQQRKAEYTKLIKYFLASLAVPDDNQWVNLSPYEKDRIIKEDFGKTEMGRDLLAQDYMLKQITASLIYPQDSLGQKFWNRVYAQAQQQFGTTNVPVNTFNKVWIIPDNAMVYEKGNTAYVVKNHLKVMLEEDYLSLEKHTGVQSQEANKTHTIASQVVREIVLPALEKEVNEGKNFAPLRQVFSGMVLAAWYKRALKESLLGRIYMNKSKLKGVDQDPKNNEIIYKQYLRAFKKGVFNFIKEDVDKYTNETIPRKYFSGGSRDTYGEKNQNGEPVLGEEGTFKPEEIPVVEEEESDEAIVTVLNMETKEVHRQKGDVAMNGAFVTQAKLGRRKNEDNGFADPQRGLFLVADGAGGHFGGEIASKIAKDMVDASLTEEQIASFRTVTEIEECLQKLVVLVNAAIVEKSKEPYLAQMATTFSLGIVWKDPVSNKTYLVGINIGDSRIYVRRADGSVEQLSKDDSKVQMMVDGKLVGAEQITSQEAEIHQERNEITDGLGRGRKKGFREHQKILIELNPGDIAFATSDGITDNLGQRYMSKIGEKATSVDPEEFAKALVSEAKRISERSSSSLRIPVETAVLEYFKLPKGSILSPKNKKGIWEPYYTHAVRYADGSRSKPVDGLVVLKENWQAIILNQATPLHRKISSLVMDKINKKKRNRSDKEERRIFKERQEKELEQSKKTIAETLKNQGRIKKFWSILREALYEVDRTKEDDKTVAAVRVDVAMNGDNKDDRVAHIMGLLRSPSLDIVQMLSAKQIQEAAEAIEEGNFINHGEVMQQTSLLEWVNIRESYTKLTITGLSGQVIYSASKVGAGASLLSNNEMGLGQQKAKAFMDIVHGKTPLALAMMMPTTEQGTRVRMPIIRLDIKDDDLYPIMAEAINVMASLGLTYQNPQDDRRSIFETALGMNQYIIGSPLDGINEIIRTARRLASGEALFTETQDLHTDRGPGSLQAEEFLLESDGWIIDLGAMKATRRIDLNYLHNHPGDIKAVFQSAVYNAAMELKRNMDGLKKVGAEITERSLVDSNSLKKVYGPGNKASLASTIKAEDMRTATKDQWEAIVSEFNGSAFTRQSYSPAVDRWMTRNIPGGNENLRAVFLAVFYDQVGRPRTANVAEKLKVLVKGELSDVAMTGHVIKVPKAIVNFTQFIEVAVAALHRPIVDYFSGFTFKNPFSDVGGIDLNAAHLNLQIKRDGKGVPLPIAQQDLENIHLDGLIPEITDIQPALNSPLLADLQVAK